MKSLGITGDDQELGDSSGSHYKLTKLDQFQSPWESLVILDKGAM